MSSPSSKRAVIILSSSTKYVGGVINISFIPSDINVTTKIIIDLDISYCFGHKGTKKCRAYLIEMASPTEI
jgi:hypothetical protein